MRKSFCLLLDDVVNESGLEEALVVCLKGDLSLMQQGLNLYVAGYTLWQRRLNFAVGHRSFGS